MDTFRQSDRPLNITGEGQYDSQGFSARLCFYTLIESVTNKIIDFYVAEKSMCEYSAKMEPYAAKVLLARLHQRRINVRVFTTDRSSLLKTLMKDINTKRKRRGMVLIKHSFDVWHYIKSVGKDIFAASKLKKCAILGEWSRSIKNMLWFSLAECKGSAELLRDSNVKLSPFYFLNLMLTDFIRKKFNSYFCKRIAIEPREVDICLATTDHFIDL
jgi:hypothetical protein